MLHNSDQSPKAPEEHPILFMMKMVADRAEALLASRSEEGVELPPPAQSRVLMFLKSRRGGPVSQRELEHHLCVSHTTAKGLVQRLEEKGYVRTAFDSEDGRVKHIYLEEFSSRAHEATRRHCQRIEECMLHGLSPVERAQLSALLHRVFRNSVS